MNRLGLTLFPLALLLIGGGAYLGLAEAPATSYRTATLSRGDIRYQVTSGGRVHASITTEVSSQLSGQIAEVHADFNDRVQEGQLLARLDPRSFEAEVREDAAALDKARAALATKQGALDKAEAALANTKALRRVAVAEAASARAKYQEARQELERLSTLKRKDLVSASDLAAARSSNDSTRALLDAAEALAEVRDAEILGAEADRRIAAAELEYAEAELRLRQAALERAQVNLGRTEIRAPIAGVVIRRNLELGQTVAASLQAPTLFTIAGDLRRMQVETQVDEADIGAIRVGQPVSFSVSAYPGQAFDGQVEQIRMAHELTQSVVTYTVVASADNPDLMLFPGMTAIVRIEVAEARNQLRVPNAALRFRPPGVEVPIAAAAAAEKGIPGRVWILGPNGRPTPVAVRTGAADDQYSALLGGPLRAGQTVLVGLTRGTR